MKDTITLPRQTVLDALRIVTEFATHNPLWVDGTGQTQDPYGAHAIRQALQAALDAPVPPEDPMLACDIAPRPLEYPLSHYHLAIGGGPLHFTWKDKPHRLVYDLIAAVKYYAQQAAPTPEPQPDKGCMTCRHGDSDGFPACPARGAGCYMGADGYGSNWEPLNSDSKPLKSYGLQGVHDAITEDPSLCDPEPKPLEGDDLHIAYMVGFNKGKQDGIKEPQRVPLTEEQIDTIVLDGCMALAWETKAIMRRLVIAIEAAHGIKEGA